MAFFGDTLAHGALLGAALALALDVNLYVAVVVACLAIAAALVGLQQQRQITGDTLLGIVAHTTLALGVIAISLQKSVQVDLFAYLFGDLLAVNWRDVLALWAGAVLILVLLALLIAGAIRTVGVLLITSLLVIPVSYTHLTLPTILRV